MTNNVYKTWIEIDTKALKKNISEFRKIVNPKTKIMAVVKSNAYGHGIWDFAKASENLIDWFGVDSIAEGLRLRKEGITKPILVLGYTMPVRSEEAVKNNISLTVYNKDELKKLAPNLKIHLKIDTGMQRQGVYVEELENFIHVLKQTKLNLEGIYTHFASAKDATYPFYTLNQIKEFKKAARILEKNGFKKFLQHTCATGGVILYKEAHFDMVRIGIGLYGYFPSKEIEIQHTLGDFLIKPIRILTWKTIIAQVKKIKKGNFIGYDLTEKMPRDGKMAVLPIGYWHGYDRKFSSVGEVLIKNNIPTFQYSRFMLC